MGDCETAVASVDNGVTEITTEKPYAGIRGVTEATAGCVVVDGRPRCLGTHLGRPPRL